MQGDSLDYLYWAYEGLAVESSWSAQNPILSPTQWTNIQNYWNDSLSNTLILNCNE